MVNSKWLTSGSKDEDEAMQIITCLCTDLEQQCSNGQPMPKSKSVQERVVLSVMCDQLTLVKTAPPAAKRYPSPNPMLEESRHHTISSRILNAVKAAN